MLGCKGLSGIKERGLKVEGTWGAKRVCGWGIRGGLDAAVAMLLSQEEQPDWHLKTGNYKRNEKTSGIVILVLV